METIKKIEWENTSNKKIQQNLLSLTHEHEALKKEISKLIDKLEEVEKEFNYGNSILEKRYRGIDE
jgi:predicted  nucleic acid-binding Zn-ribbon protein